MVLCLPASTGSTMYLNGVAIVTTGSDLRRNRCNSGGQTTISGGSVSTSGDNAAGLYATGAGSSIATSNGRRSRHPDRRQTACMPTRSGARHLERRIGVGQRVPELRPHRQRNGTQIQATNLSASSSVNNWTAVQADTGSSLTYAGGSITTIGTSRLVGQPQLDKHRSDGNGSGCARTSPMAHRSSATGSRSPSTERPILRRATTPSSRSMRATLDPTRCELSNSIMSASGAFNFGVTTSGVEITILTNDLISVTGPNTIVSKAIRAARRRSAAAPSARPGSSIGLLAPGRGRASQFPATDYFRIGDSIDGVQADNADTSR